MFWIVAERCRTRERTHTDTVKTNSTQKDRRTITQRQHVKHGFKKRAIVSTQPCGHTVGTWLGFYPTIWTWLLSPVWFLEDTVCCRNLKRLAIIKKWILCAAVQALHTISPAHLGPQSPGYGVYWVGARHSLIAHTACWVRASHMNYNYKCSCFFLLFTI